MIKICGNCLCSKLDGKKFTKKDFKFKVFLEIDNICDDCYPVLKAKHEQDIKDKNEPQKNLSVYYSMRDMDSVKLLKRKKK